MTHQRITSLELVAEDDWARARADLDARVAANGEAVEAVQLVRVDDRRGVLLACDADADALARFATVVLEPWLGAHGRAHSTVHGETLWRVGRDDHRELDALADADRCARFVGEVVARGTVWGLYGETWARSPAAGDVEALPFWSQRELAARCVAGPWQSFVPRAIELPAFVEQWLGGMHEDGIVAVIMPTPTHPGAIVAPDELAAALRRPTDAVR